MLEYSVLIAGVLSVQSAVTNACERYRRKRDIINGVVGGWSTLIGALRCVCLLCLCCVALSWFLILASHFVVVFVPALIWRNRRSAFLDSHTSINNVSFTNAGRVRFPFSLS